jgi:hypothetical protein
MFIPFPFYYAMMDKLYLSFKISGIEVLNPYGPCQVANHQKLIFPSAITAVVLCFLSLRYEPLNIYMPLLQSEQDWSVDILVNHLPPNELIIHFNMLSASVVHRIRGQR